MLFRIYYCSNRCRHLNRTKDIDSKRKEILSLYSMGMTIQELALKYGVGSPRLNYHFRKWKVRIRRCYEYPEIMKSIAEQKTSPAQRNFLQNYREGKISWRAAHRWASRTWKITDRPCDVCGWDKAERDMHLVVPRLLEEKNAVSVCPNCHRLFHRNLLSTSNLIVKI